MFLMPLLCLLAAWAGLILAADDSLPDNVKKIPLRTHSISTPYLDSDLQSRWFDFGGDTIVRADKYIRLASDLQSRTGWLFSKIPLTASNWEIEVEFKISGKATLHGDGMAMWITKQRAQQGPVFGHADKFEGLGIFFDTYKNERAGVVFPMVMAMVGDGQTSYNKETDGKDQDLAFCSARGLRGATTPTKARLTYYQDKSLKLDLQYKSEDTWTNCFESGSVKLPPVSYLGFSAETGELSDNFDIIKVETSNLYSSTPNEAPKSGPHEGRRARGNRYAPKPKSRGWGWTFVKLVLFVVVCGGAYFGYMQYKGQKSGGGKRTRFD